MISLKNIKFWIFDLDNTLYSSTTNIFSKIDKKMFAEKSKEYADLNEIIQDAKKYISYEKDRSELEKIINDKNSDTELIKMAEKELNDLKIENQNNHTELRD